MINWEVTVISSLLSSDTNFEQQIFDGIGPNPVVSFRLDETTHLLVISFIELTGNTQANNRSRGLNKLSVAVAIVHRHLHVHGENCV